MMTGWGEEGSAGGGRGMRGWQKPLGLGGHRGQGDNDIWDERVIAVFIERGTI